MTKISFRNKWVTKMERWSGEAILQALTTYEVFLANPEAAFGVVRKLNTKRKLTVDQVHQFLRQHPSWSQLPISIGTKNTPNAFFSLLANSEWGQKNEVHATYQLQGTVKVTWEGKNGTKTKKIDLSMEMVGYGSDTREFISLTMGGSMIQARLLKDGTKVNMEASDDHKQKRYVVWGDRLEDLRLRQETKAISTEPSSDVLAALMRGETVSCEAGLWEKV